MDTPAVYALTLAYRGTAYAGWQRQANALAVQQVVEEALEDLLGHPTTVIGASRTDAGVHARAQVAHLELATPFPERGLVGGTNGRLVRDVRVMAARRMAPLPGGRTFHARKDARSKVYRYRLMRTPVVSPLDALFVVRAAADLDVGAMRRAAARLAGDHDFSAFALAGGAHTSPVRRLLSATWEERGAALDFVVEGEGFLRGMVRSLVGTLLEVGEGRRSVESFADLLAGRPRGEAGPTAPPEGLVLERVLYPSPWEKAGEIPGPVLW